MALEKLRSQPNRKSMEPTKETCLSEATQQSNSIDGSNNWIMVSHYNSCTTKADSDRVMVVSAINYSSTEQRPVTVVTKYFVLQSLLPNTAMAWKIDICRRMEIALMLDAKNVLLPKHSTLSFAPEDIIDIISCNCKTICGWRCRCIKNNLKCTDLCGQCAGVSCANVESLDFDEMDADKNDNAVTSREF